MYALSYSLSSSLKTISDIHNLKMIGIFGHTVFRDLNTQLHGSMTEMEQKKGLRRGELLTSWWPERWEEPEGGKLSGAGLQ